MDFYYTIEIPCKVGDDSGTLNLNCRNVSFPAKPNGSWLLSSTDTLNA